MIETGLKGNELIVWGYLAKKAYNVMGAYTGGLKNVAKDLHLSEPTVINIVNKLVERGIFQKNYFIDENNVRRCSLCPIYND